MMADAFATRPREVAEMIRELIDPSYYNSGANSLKETFLANMYRIVSAATKELYRGITPFGPLLWQAEADIELTLFMLHLE